MENAQPCFSINDTQESRTSPPEIASVTVRRHNASNSDLVWAVDLTALTPHLRLAPDQCMQYSAKIPEAIEVKAPEPLRLGGHYSVSINAFLTAPPGKPDKLQNRRYLRDFCLSLASDGSIEAIYVPRRSGKPNWELCKPRADPVVISLAVPPQRTYKNAAIHGPYPAQTGSTPTGPFSHKRGVNAG